MHARHAGILVLRRFNTKQKASAYKNVDMWISMLMFTIGPLLYDYEYAGVKSASLKMYPQAILIINPKAPAHSVTIIFSVII